MPDSTSPTFLWFLPLDFWCWLQEVGYQRSTCIPWLHCSPHQLFLENIGARQRISWCTFCTHFAGCRSTCSNTIKYVWLSPQAWPDGPSKGLRGHPFCRAPSKDCRPIHLLIRDLHYQYRAKRACGFDGTTAWTLAMHSVAATTLLTMFAGTIKKETSSTHLKDWLRLPSRRTAKARS